MAAIPPPLTPPAKSERESTVRRFEQSILSFALLHCSGAGLVEMRTTYSWAIGSPFSDDSTIRRKTRRASASLTDLILSFASKDVAFYLKKKKSKLRQETDKKIIRNYGISQFGDFDAGVAGAAAERLHLQLGLAVQLPCDVGRAWISCKIDGDVTRLAEHETVQRHLIFGLRRDCDG